MAGDIATAAGVSKTNAYEHHESGHSQSASHGGEEINCLRTGACSKPCSLAARSGA